MDNVTARIKGAANRNPSVFAGFRRILQQNAKRAAANITLAAMPMYLPNKSWVWGGGNGLCRTYKYSASRHFHIQPGSTISAADSSTPIAAANERTSAFRSFH